jgi:hypothetical protein
VVVADEVMIVLCPMSVKPVGTVKSAYLVEVVEVMIVVVAGTLRNELQKVDAGGPKFLSTKRAGRAATEPMSAGQGREIASRSCRANKVIFRGSPIAWLLSNGLYDARTTLSYELAVSPSRFAGC